MQSWFRAARRKVKISNYLESTKGRALMCCVSPDRALVPRQGSGPQLGSAGSRTGIYNLFRRAMSRYQLAPGTDIGKGH